MGSGTLVDIEVGASKALVELLNARSAKVYAAFWLLDDESSNWAFHIAAQVFEDSGRHAAYQTIAECLAAIAEPGGLALHSIVVTSRFDPTVRLLGSAIRVGGMSEVRLSNNVINGVRIPDALIMLLDLSAPPVAKKTVAKTRRTGLIDATAKTGTKSKVKRKKR